MTENEAIKVLENHFQFLRESWKPYPDGKVLDALSISISSMKGIQQYRSIGTVDELSDMKKDYAEAISDWRQYRKIGTVEECRAAVEKQREKKPMNIRLLETSGIHCGVCPICKNPVYADLRNLNHREYCGHCGQAIDWSDAP